MMPAWLLAKRNDVIPIPEMIRYLEQYLGALNVKLTAKENHEIREVVEEAEIVGERYPDGMATNILADTPALA